MPNYGMKASPLTALSISVGLFLVLISSSAHHDFSTKPAQSGDASLAFYAELVKETELCRRVNVLFPNSQSLFDGMQVGYVGVRHGNLTFRRRDLVAGTNPLAKFTRVYDSRFRHGRDFGPGWHLSLNEELTVADEGLVYRDGSGATHSFIRAAPGAGLGSGALPEERGMLPTSSEHPSVGVFPAVGIYTAFPSTPQHEFTSIEVAGSVAVLHTRGETRVFERTTGSVQAPNSYRLSRVLSGERQILLSYRNGLIDTVSDGAGLLFSVNRNVRGRIASVQDRWGRQTYYRYDPGGHLQEARDVAGNAWTYDYGPLGTLTRAVGPNGRDVLRIRYDGAGRVAESFSGRQHSFTYAEGETVVAEGTGHLHVFGHNAAGITERFESTNGLWWRLTLDGRNRVTEVRSSRGTYKYSYAPTGVIESMEEQSAGSHTFRLFTHDSLGRITGVYSDQGGWAEVDYSGGLTRIAGSATQLEFDLLPSGRIAFAGRDETLISADYDRYGNLIALHNGGNIMELAVPGLRDARAMLAMAEPLFSGDGARAMMDFEKPSNPVFQPLEYRSTNCCIRIPTHMHQLVPDGRPFSNGMPGLPFCLAPLFDSPSPPSTGLPSYDPPELAEMPSPEEDNTIPMRAWGLYAQGDLHGPIHLCNVHGDRYGALGR